MADRKKILIVEDDADISMVEEAYLQSAGFDTKIIIEGTFLNREFEILKFFAENPNIVFSKEQIFEKIWGYDYAGDSATIMVHINRIREKIEDDSKNPRILETVWGAGYRLNN